MSSGGPLLAWSNVAAVAGDSSSRAWVQAAEADLRAVNQELSVSGQSPYASALNIDALNIDGLDTLVVTVNGPDGGRTVELGSAVIRQAFNAGMRPLELVASALGVAEPLTPGWSAKLVGGGWRPVVDQLPGRPWASALTQASRDLDRAVLQGHDVVLTGKHGSGKTAAAAHLAERCRSVGDRVVWLDLTDPADGVATIFLTLLSEPFAARYLLVVDGAQSNVAVLPRVRDCVTELRSTYGLVVTLVMTASPSLFTSAPNLFADMQRVNAKGEDLVEVLLGHAQLEPEVAAQVRTLVQGDAHLADAALLLLSENHSVPTWADLQSVYTANTANEDEQKVLYWFACLNVLEIEVPAALARNLFHEAVVDSLRSRRLLRVNESSYTIGNKAAAEMVLAQALQQWDASARWGRPEQVVWDYLQLAGEAHIMAALERMDLIGVAADPSLSPATRYLARAWDSRRRLERQLERSGAKDETWNDCIGAAVFAGLAFAELNNLVAWRRVAKFVRSRFSYGITSDLPAPNGGTTDDRRDFDEIAEAMAIEDGQVGVVNPTHELAGAVDLDRFYRTWVLGLLLGFEGDALEQDQERIARLLKIAAERQEADGSFYPRRVPWVTARVLLGLVAAGQTYENSEVVRRACDWLRLVTSGGEISGWWRSGTGSWNTDELTTAMAFTALHRSGAPTPATAMLWLRQRESEWTRRDRQIDLVLVLEAMLLDNERPDVIHPHVLSLLSWALHVTADGAPTPSTDIPEDNLRLPFVTAQLTGLIWITLTREFSHFLAEVVSRHNLRATAAASEPRLPSASRSGPPLRASEPHINFTGDQLGEWRRAVHVLWSTLAHEISTRDTILRRQPENVVISERISALYADRDRCAALRQQLAESTPDTVLTELESMGRSLCGPAWPEPPRPGTGPTRR